MTDRVQNYTPEQTQDMIAAYQAGTTVEQIAEALGKSVRSVVAKLSREGVYTPKQRAVGQARRTRADLAQELAERCELNAQQQDNLAKCNHDVLEQLVARVRGLQQQG